MKTNLNDQKVLPRQGKHKISNGSGKIENSHSKKKQIAVVLAHSKAKSSQRVMHNEYHGLQRARTRQHSGSR